MRDQYLTRTTPSGELCFDGVSLTKLADAVGTPCYVYSATTLLDTFSAFKSAAEQAGLDATVCVSVKANSNLSLLRLLVERGAGFDIVSGGELERVRAVGGDVSRTVFAGVGKTDEEIDAALQAGILALNVESEEELERIELRAQSLALRAPVSLRVNPNIDGNTHAHINTGLAKHKFGITLERAAEIYREAQRFQHLDFIGVDCHIGSSILDLSAFRGAFQKLRGFVETIRPVATKLQFVDVGGGLGVAYREEAQAPSVAEYIAIVRESFGDFGLRILFEPGKFLFANAGLLLTRVLYAKQNPEKKFVIVDAGFNDLIRPAFYQAYHRIQAVSDLSGQEQHPVDVVGPVCETGDCFAHDRLMPSVERGELVAVLDAGAYGFTMASNYNTRPRPVEVLVRAGQATIIRPRDTLASMLKPEQAALANAEPIPL